MIKILGSLFLALSTPILALSTASVNQTWFYPGDQVVLTLSANGNNVIFPDIRQIDGNPVLYTSNAQKIQIINNQQSRKSSKSFVIKPLTSISIPPYTITADGDKQTTKGISVSLKQPSEAKAGDDYILTIKTNKSSFFLGDETNLEISFKEKKSLTNNNQASISMPEVKGLLFIKTGQSAQSSDKDYNIHTINYKVVADNFGQFNIPPVVISIGKQNASIFGNFDPLSQTRKLRKIHSNTLTLSVKPLPDAIRVFGSFKISANVDKTTVEQGQATNLIVSIQGSGNFEDIEPYKLDIANATIYNNEAEFNYNQWQQKFAIVGTQDFSIPAFKLDYFDKQSETTKTITTEAINIKVVGKKPTIQNKTDNTQIPTNISNNLPANNLKYVYLLIGIIIGVAISMLVSAYKNRQTTMHASLINQIKLARGDKALFDLLLPLNMPALETVLHQLEANIYKDAQHKIRKKDVINVIRSQNKTD